MSLGLMSLGLMSPWRSVAWPKVAPSDKQIASQYHKYSARKVFGGN